MNRIRRFVKCRRGATAVEFALIMPVFMYLLMGTIEMAHMLYTTTIVENAIIESSRRVRTGQADGTGNALSDFTTTLCNRVSNYYSCGQITVDVASSTTGNFDGVTWGLVIDQDGNIISGGGPAGSGEVTRVQVIYDINFYTPLLGNLFGDSGGNTRQITATAVFRAEPFAD